MFELLRAQFFMRHPLHKNSPDMSVCLSGTLPRHEAAPMYWVKHKTQTTSKLDHRVTGGGESESDIRNELLIIIS
jgi:hypothetical protein